MNPIKREGYEFQPLYHDEEKRGLLVIKKETDRSLVRELPMPYKGEKPSNEEVEEAIDYFFEHIHHFQDEREH